jgi:hypothetical protein
MEQRIGSLVHAQGRVTNKRTGDRQDLLQRASRVEGAVRRVLWHEGTESTSVTHRLTKAAPDLELSPVPDGTGPGRAEGCCTTRRHGYDARRLVRSGKNAGSRSDGQSGETGRAGEESAQDLSPRGVAGEQILCDGTLIDRCVLSPWFVHGTSRSQPRT